MALHALVLKKHIGFLVLLLCILHLSETRFSSCLFMALPLLNTRSALIGQLKHA